METPERRLKVLLCGYGHLGLAVLQGLLAQPEHCDVVGVFRWISKAGTANYWEPIEATLQETVEANGIRDIVCAGMNHYEFSDILEQLKPDVVMVGSWGEILKPHLLDRPDILFVNCHPSKLPAHRGANPYASVIMAGETETGVTFHLMSKEIDAGAILHQKTTALTEHDTGETVRQKCFELVTALMGDVIASLHDHCVQGVPLQAQEQDVALKSYYPQLKLESGLIPWHEDAEGLYRHCRALYPWIACYSHLEGKQMVRLFSPRFVPKPPQFPDMPGGTILAFYKGVLAIALNDPAWMLEVPMYQFAHGEKGWSLWLSKLLAPLMFKPGRRFSNPGA